MSKSSCASANASMVYAGSGLRYCVRMPRMAARSWSVIVACADVVDTKKAAIATRVMPSMSVRNRRIEPPVS